MKICCPQCVLFVTVKVFISLIGMRVLILTNRMLISQLSHRFRLPAVPLHQTSGLRKATEPTQRGIAHCGLYKLVRLAIAPHYSSRFFSLLVGHQLLCWQPALWLLTRRHDNRLAGQRQTVWECEDPGQPWFNTKPEVTVSNKLSDRSWAQTASAKLKGGCFAQESPEQMEKLKHRVKPSTK